MTNTALRAGAQISDKTHGLQMRMINRILLGEPKKVDGIKTQEVRIVYNFVGEL